MIFEAVGRGTSLVDSVVGQVQKLIAEGRLSAGARLPKEDELVAQLGVSRTVLREAIGRLKANGLVTIQRGRGMFVAEPGDVASAARLVRNAMTLSARDLEQFLEFRRIIECQAARRAAERATPQDIDALRALVLEMNRPDQDFIASVRLDFAFHLKVVEISGNQLMRSALQVLQEFIMTSMVKTTPNPRDYDASRKYHMDVVDAIATRDPDVAEAGARAHMELSERSLREKG